MFSVVSKGDLGESFILSACKEMPIMEHYRAIPVKRLCAINKNHLITMLMNMLTQEVSDTAFGTCSRHCTGSCPDISAHSEIACLIWCCRPLFPFFPYMKQE